MQLDSTRISRLERSFSLGMSWSVEGPARLERAAWSAEERWSSSLDGLCRSRDGEEGLVRENAMIVEMVWICLTRKGAGEKREEHQSRYGPNWEAQQDTRPGMMGRALAQTERVLGRRRPSSYPVRSRQNDWITAVSVSRHIPAARRPTSLFRRARSGPFASSAAHPIPVNPAPLWTLLGDHRKKTEKEPSNALSLILAHLPIKSRPRSTG